MSVEKIGILTSGGDCPGLNAVIRGAVLTANTLGYDVVGFKKGYEGLVDPVTYMSLNLENTASILNQGGTILGSTNQGRFAATCGENNRIDLDPVLLAGVQATCEQLNLKGLVCIGGDGSLGIAQQFHEHGIPVVGVPKTIDNDLMATAFTFGFDSAVDCATEALDRLQTTAQSHERIMVMEVMGRHAGWIGLHAGIAGGADIILLPEVKWTYENICQQILKREQKGFRSTLIVVAEGTELPNNQLVTAEEEQENRQTRLGGVGNIITDEIHRRIGKLPRTMVLGHLQRGGAPTTFDRVLATQFGAHSIRLIEQGLFGQMACYDPPAIKSVAIADAINRLSKVNVCGSTLQAARALGISFGDAFEGNPFVCRVPDAESDWDQNSSESSLENSGTAIADQNDSGSSTGSTPSFSCRM